MRLALFLIAALLPTLPAAAQDKPPTFDVASVKPTSRNRPGGRMVVGMSGREGGPGTGDPTRVRYAAISMRFLLSESFGEKGMKFVGPDWMDEEFYQLDATLPPGTSEAQFRAMMQRLVTERFKLAFHRETKSVQGYTLVVAKGGAKLKESSETPPPGSRPGSRIQQTESGARISFQAQNLDRLADFLSGQLGGPVTNATGLTAKYDFALTFSKPGAETADSPDITNAVQQLGLKLEQAKATEQRLIIDHVEKVPTEN